MRIVIALLLAVVAGCAVAALFGVPFGGLPVLCAFLAFILPFTRKARP